LIGDFSSLPARIAHLHEILKMAGMTPELLDDCEIALGFWSILWRILYRTILPNNEIQDLQNSVVCTRRHRK
jgi:hypothetical protein